jgi:Protein of unknown function (DUF707)
MVLVPLCYHGPARQCALPPPQVISFAQAKQLQRQFWNWHSYGFLAGEQACCAFAEFDRAPQCSAQHEITNRDGLQITPRLLALEMVARPSRFLLISRVGPQSLHGHWLGDTGERGFDIILSAYSGAVADPCRPGVVFEYRPGTKVAGYAAIFEAHAALIARYDYIALFDDDLLVDCARIMQLFEIISSQNLKIAQPALTHDSHFTFGALLRDRSFRLRYVNYIEMMCPVFRADTFENIKPLFSLGYESGIDLIWCNLVCESSFDFAVIDAVTVQHTRAVGATKSANGFTGVRRYEDDIYAILARFALPWLACVPYAGIRLDGTVERRRLAFCFSSLRLLGAIGQGVGLRQRTRAIAVYWKHLAHRTSMNIKTSWPHTVRNGDNREIETKV